MPANYPMPSAWIGARPNSYSPVRTERRSRSVCSSSASGSSIPQSAPKPDNSPAIAGPQMRMRKVALNDAVENPSQMTLENLEVCTDGK